MFDGLLESGKLGKGIKPGWVLFSVSVHFAIMTGLFIASLIHYNEIPEIDLVKPLSDLAPPLIPPPFHPPPDAVVDGVLHCGLGMGSMRSARLPDPQPHDRKRVHRVDGSLLAAKLIRRVGPRYPDLARRKGGKERVFLRIVVDRQGGVRDAQAVSGPMVLVDPALRAVRRWKFEPTRLDGRPIEVAAIMPVDFRRP